jgi:hypothetical protein
MCTRRGQPVEKVVVGPVGSPKHPRTQAKTLQNRGFKPLNRGKKRARGSFSTGWGVLGSPHSPGPTPMAFPTQTAGERGETRVGLGRLWPSTFGGEMQEFAMIGYYPPDVGGGVYAVGNEGVTLEEAKQVHAPRGQGAVWRRKPNRLQEGVDPLWIGVMAKR